MSGFPIQCPINAYVQRNKHAFCSSTCAVRQVFFAKLKKKVQISEMNLRKGQILLVVDIIWLYLTFKSIFSW